MKKIAVLGAAFLGLALSAPAKAADVPVKAPVYKAAPAPAFNWTGFYFGGHIGYGEAEDPIGATIDGMIGGVQVGYNWHFSRNWVFGIEADIAGTDMNNAFGAHMDYLGTIRARAGYAMDRVLIYGTGGFAFSRIQNVLGAHLNGEGYAIGAGLEWAFARNWSAKVEYMFHDIDFGPGDVEVSTFKFGVNYRFGR